VNKKRLDSWKANAVFPTRSLRTVPQWHECGDLSVRRGDVGAQSAAVICRGDEREVQLRAGNRFFGALNGKSGGLSLLTENLITMNVASFRPVFCVGRLGAAKIREI
jgi:hypothetical protein